MEDIKEIVPIPSKIETQIFNPCISLIRSLEKDGEKDIYGYYLGVVCKDYLIVDIEPKNNDLPSPCDIEINVIISEFHSGLGLDNYKVVCLGKSYTEVFGIITIYTHFENGRLENLNYGPDLKGKTIIRFEDAIIY
ncbi:hypothetical protein [Aureispira anguillae]|uniref:Uncharacterized protein n=1 Tax=Aureispira anguillae TaxID=2864201 RepID=A0A915YH88_9BACT|nr:hypothetical protein [Aureispira anguillae]BDS12946.1 hypothetical protein AsAng_0036710 [Aureispira anguillae]